MSISRVFPPSKAEKKSKLCCYTSLLGNSWSGKCTPPEAKGSHLVAWDHGSHKGNTSGTHKAETPNTAAVEVDIDIYIDIDVDLTLTSPPKFFSKSILT